MKTQGVARDVEVRNVSKTFETQKGEQVVALDDINLHIASSEFVSVVGTSGCGKSTLLRIVCGLIGATSGKVFVGGEQVEQPRDDVGVVFQNAVLLPWLTVKDNILLPMELRQKRRREHDER